MNSDQKRKSEYAATQIGSENSGPVHPNPEVVFNNCLARIRCVYDPRDGKYRFLYDNGVYLEGVTADTVERAAEIQIACARALSLQAIRISDSMNIMVNHVNSIL